MLNTVCDLASACLKQHNKGIIVFLSLRLSKYLLLGISVPKYLKLRSQYLKYQRHYQMPVL